MMRVLTPRSGLSGTRTVREYRCDVQGGAIVEEGAASSCSTELPFACR